MNTCKTCKYWDTKDQLKPSSYGAPCARIAHYGLISIAEREEFGGDEDGASIEGTGQLWTKPDFGCQMHEAS